MVVYELVYEILGEDGWRWTARAFSDIFAAQMWALAHAPASWSVKDHDGETLVSGCAAHIWE